MKKNTFFLGCGIGTLLALAGCSGTGSSPESFVRSDYYTRGIGVYPGNPKEDFSPELLPDANEYRNLARMRATTQSSAYDYNLTAQLATDGLVTEEQPRYLVLSTPEGEKPKREREWMIDGGPYSRNTVQGEDTYFMFALRNYTKTIGRATITGTLAFDDKAAQGGYEMTWEGSNDGQEWTALDSHKGSGLPGKSSSGRVTVNDPNKQTGDISMPVRRLNETFNFPKEAPYSYYRIHLKMKGAYAWTFHEIAFANHEGEVNLKPSQFFTSTWMSATAGTEWLCVDLGSCSTFDKINLHWINKAIKGKIQTSDNAKDWQDLAELPGEESRTDVLDVQGKARYVRILMEESANGQPYMLSEVEVMGRGGLVPQPAPMPAIADGEMTLSGGNWQVQRASEVKESGEVISTPDYPSDRLHPRCKAGSYSDA